MPPDREADPRWDLIKRRWRNICFHTLNNSLLVALLKITKCHYQIQFRFKWTYLKSISSWHLFLSICLVALIKTLRPRAAVFF